MATLWLNAATKAYWDELTEQRTHNEAMRVANALYALRNPSPFEKKVRAMLESIDSGDSDRAAAEAKSLATDVYDNRLDRCFCEHTGYPYFDAGYDY